MADDIPPVRRGADEGRLVVMGRIDTPYGVRGWVNVHTFTEAPDSLLQYRCWWLGRGPELARSAGGWRETEVLEARSHAGRLVAHLAGVEDRDIALGLRGLEVAVPRSWMPALEQGEFYWDDLVGLEVVNHRGERLGAVSGVFSTGSNDVLRVAAAGSAEAAGSGAEILIPYVEKYVGSVDLAAREIRVEWERDW